MKFKNGKEIINGEFIYTIVSNKDYDDIPVMPNILLPQFIRQLETIDKTKGYYDDNGDYVEGIGQKSIFEGAIMPLTQDDLKLIESGQIAFSNKKLYVSEGNTLRVYYLKRVDKTDD